jgi:hypothetical protein
VFFLLAAGWVRYFANHHNLLQLRAYPGYPSRIDLVMGPEVDVYGIVQPKAFVNRGHQCAEMGFHSVRWLGKNRDEILVKALGVDLDLQRAQ